MMPERTAGPIVSMRLPLAGREEDMAALISRMGGISAFVVSLVAVAYLAI